MCEILARFVFDCLSVYFPTKHTLDNILIVSSNMKKNLILLVIFVISNLAEAQFIKEKSINAQIGYGMSVPYYSADDIINSGFFMFL